MNETTKKLIEFQKEYEKIFNIITYRIDGNDVLVCLNWQYKFTIENPNLEQWILIAKEWNTDTDYWNKIPQKIRLSNKFKIARLEAKIKTL